jgi:hypothetical protein
MERGEELVELVGTARGNAVLAWLLVGFLGVVIAGSLRRGDTLWAGFAAAVAGLAVAPAVGRRSPSAMLPWEVLALAALPLIGRAVARTRVGGEFATYIGVAALALIIAVELDTFTAVRMTPGFAVAFVVVGTMATAGAWAVVRWSVDVWTGTTFLLDPALGEAAIEKALMWEFVYSTAAGVAGGVVFEWYFRRRARAAERLPEEAGPGGAEGS